jgi:hypothetical protein
MGSGRLPVQQQAALPGRQIDRREVEFVPDGVSGEVAGGEAEPVVLPHRMWSCSSSRVTSPLVAAVSIPDARMILATSLWLTTSLLASRSSAVILGDP